MTRTEMSCEKREDGGDSFSTFEESGQSKETRSLPRTDFRERG